MWGSASSLPDSVSPSAKWECSPAPVRTTEGKAMSADSIDTLATGAGTRPPWPHSPLPSLCCGQLWSLPFTDTRHCPRLLGAPSPGPCRGHHRDAPHCNALGKDPCITTAPHQEETTQTILLMVRHYKQGLPGPGGGFSGWARWGGGWAQARSKAVSLVARDPALPWEETGRPRDRKGCDSWCPSQGEAVDALCGGSAAGWSPLPTRE